MRHLINLFEDTDYGKRQFFSDLSPYRSKQFGFSEKEIEVPQWPMNPQQLKEIERIVFQDPEWLQYWAHFGWRSFTSTTDWWFNKHDNLFVFYNVPAIAYFNDKLSPDSRMIYMTTEGVVVEKKSQYSHLTEILPTALEVCRDVVRNAQPKLRFLQGRYYIRFGMWPKNERSRNWLNREEEVYEQGVSVYHVDFDLSENRWAIDPSVNEDTITGTLENLLYGNRPIYLVQGDEIDEEGSDGEPLLHNVKLISQLDRNQVYVPGIFDPKNDE